MGPFKCPDCGVWWAGFEHRCSPTRDATDSRPWTPTTMPEPYVVTVSNECTCHLKGRTVPESVWCRIHDILYVS